jgi:hypothetical protein
MKLARRAGLAVRSCAAAVEPDESKRSRFIFVRLLIDRTLALSSRLFIQARALLV